MSLTCLDCAKLQRENERLQAEVIRLAQQRLELKKFIIEQEETAQAGREAKHDKTS